MKRGGFLKRKTPLQSYKGIISSKPLKRVSQLAKSSGDTVALVKDRIQGLARQIVIKRDGGCILRHIAGRHPGFPQCGGYRSDGELVLQADHLVTRANAATYADTRLIVCLCRDHHGWKSLGNNARKAEYDELVRAILPPERVKLWDDAEAFARRHQPTRMTLWDWQKTELALNNELAASNKSKTI